MTEQRADALDLIYAGQVGADRGTVLVRLNARVCSV